MNEFLAYINHNGKLLPKYAQHWYTRAGIEQLRSATCDIGICYLKVVDTPSGNKLIKRYDIFTSSEDIISSHVKMSFWKNNFLSLLLHGLNLLVHDRNIFGSSSFVFDNLRCLFKMSGNLRLAFPRKSSENRHKRLYVL